MFLEGKNFALGLKASGVLAMIIFLFSFDSLSFSSFWWFFCVLADIVQLICWSGRVFHSILWIVFQDLSCYVFLLRRIKISLYFGSQLVQHFFSRLFELFFHSAENVLNSSCSAKQFKMNRVSIRNEIRIRNRIKPWSPFLYARYSKFVLGYHL